MAIQLTSESFLRIVKQSKLLTKEKIKSLISEMQAAGLDLNSVDAIAGWLVEKNHLTNWQVEKLRTKGGAIKFFIGKYRLLELLGKGGMSSVYLAEHTLMRRRCAIKVLPIKKVHDSSYLARFRREAQAVASLDHPNIVRAYDIDCEVEQDQEIHFLVMEYVKGGSIQDIVKPDALLGFEDAVEYTRQAALGLGDAHNSGLIHRDVKPGNLLVDETGCVKVLDLGLARFAEVSEENSVTVANDERVLGTADYLSPEQALDSHKVDARADIYSLGCTLYFALTAQPPFNEGSIAQRLLAHQTKEPPAISEIRPDTPQSLIELIEKMMKKDPGERFQTMSEVAEATKKWLDANASPDWKKANGLGVPVATATPVVAAPVAMPIATAIPVPPVESAALPSVTAEGESDASFSAFLTNLGDTGTDADPNEFGTPAPQPGAHGSDSVPHAPVVTPAVEHPIESNPGQTQPLGQELPGNDVTTPQVAPAVPVDVPPTGFPTQEQPTAQSDVVPEFNLDSSPNLDPDFISGPGDSGSIGDFPSLFSSGSTQSGVAPASESPPEGEVTVSETAETIAYIPPIPGTPNEKTLIVNTNQAEPSLAAPDVADEVAPGIPVADSVPSADPVTGHVEAVPDGTHDFGRVGPHDGEATIPEGGPIPSADQVQGAAPIEGKLVPDSDEIASQETVEPETGSHLQRASDVAPPLAGPVPNVAQQADSVDFGNFGAAPTFDPSAPQFNGTNQESAPGQTPLVSSPSQAPVFNDPYQAAHTPSANVIEGAPVGFGEMGFGATSPAASSSTEPRTPVARRAKKKSPVSLIIGIVVVLGAGIGAFVAFSGGKDDGSDGKTVQGDSKGNSKNGSGSSGTQGGSATSGPLKLKLAVGPNSEYKTISAALTYVKANNLRYMSMSRRNRIMIEVESGKTYNESIKIDNSSANYPRGIQIIAKDGRATLKSQAGPVLQLKDVENFLLSEFDLDAGGADIAIEVGGYMNRSQLKGLKVSAFSQSGLLAKGAAGVSTDFLQILDVEFVGSGNAGVTITQGTAPSSRIRVSGCRFLGPFQTGISVETGITKLEVRENVFVKTTEGIKLGSMAMAWHDLIFTNNTFSQGGKGIVFGAMPLPGSRGFVFHRNLFAGQSGPELSVLDGFDDKKFDAFISTGGNGGVDLNFTDRQQAAQISAGERDIVIRDERRVAKVEFASTNSSDEKFMNPKRGTPYGGRIGRPTNGAKPYIGAVEPR